MITGIVRGDEGRIRLTVRGPLGERGIEAVVDTGYTASLTLPPTVVAALGLIWRSIDRGILADGRECDFDVYHAEIAWDGQARRILVEETDAEPLVGMRLLRGHELTMHVRSGGKVAIKPLPER